MMIIGRKDSEELLMKSIGTIDALSKPVNAPTGQKGLSINT